MNSVCTTKHSHEHELEFPRFRSATLQLFIITTITSVNSWLQSIPNIEYGKLLIGLTTTWMMIWESYSLDKHSLLRQTESCNHSVQALRWWSRGDVMNSYRENDNNKRAPHSTANGRPRRVGRRPSIQRVHSASIYIPLSTSSVLALGQPPQGVGEDCWHHGKLVICYLVSAQKEEQIPGDGSRGRNL